ncbi:39S ribosomal protein L43, mitochondrial [Batrachochytrium dendrobatidis]|nr:39S ribosomal protein L43, mitochondrial [Batrachochytrium dendrobatidis]
MSGRFPESLQPVKRLMQELSVFPKLKKKLLLQKNMDSVNVNGVGSFVPSICRLKIFYESPRIGAGGTSRSMVDFLKHNITSLAQSRPYIEFNVVHRRGAPELEATYNNGSTRNIICSKLNVKQIKEKTAELCDGSGSSATGRKFAQPVKKGAGSQRDLVNPTWNPFHSKDVYRP